MIPIVRQASPSALRNPCAPSRWKEVAGAPTLLSPSSLLDIAAFHLRVRKARAAHLSSSGGEPDISSRCPLCL